MSILLLIAATTSPVVTTANDCRPRFIPASTQTQPQRDPADNRRRPAVPKQDRPTRPCYILASL